MFKIFILILCINNSWASSNLKKNDYNVIFIALDALQARHVHSLGYEKNTTPFIDKLSKKGVLFSNAISPASWTVPTYLSIFSSTFPSEHGMKNRYVKFDKNEKILSNFPKSNPSLKTIAQILKLKGYSTAGFTGDSGLAAALGYNSGFDEYTDETPFGGIENSYARSKKWLDSLKKEDHFFLFLHGYDCHGQFKVEKNYKGNFYSSDNAIIEGTPETQGKIREQGLANQQLTFSTKDVNFWRAWYDSKIFDADSHLEKIYSDLDKRGLLKNTIVFIFSDHGTEFLEHGKFDHGHTLYDELLNVPLLMIPPWKTNGTIVNNQVSTIDLLPTVIDLLKITPDENLKHQIKGVSLLPLLTKTKTKFPDRDIFSETDLRNYTHKRSIRTADGWKYIMTLETGSDELYDLKKDPREQHNLAGIDLKKVLEVREKLLIHLSSMKTDFKALGTECLPVYKGQCE
ncbi:MAG: sulfatase [Bacteriovorax sp.]|nr:sulfatase [Bacteriovorax sp.]